MSIKPIGVQLYSLRSYAEKDFAAVLKKVADIGYKYVEPAGLWNIRPRDFRKILDDLGLEMISSHTPWCNYWTQLGECMDTADALGLDKVVCGYWEKDYDDLDSIKRTAENTNKMMEILKRNGLTLFQHNHYMEFRRLDGRIKYDIYREMCPGIKFEMDCFWSTNHGVEDSVEMLKQFADDTILIHMKDGVTTQQVSGDNMVNGFQQCKVDLMPLGTGELPIPQLVKAMPDHIQAIIVELDYCNVEMNQAIEQSYHYMVDNGLAYGNK